MGSTTQIHNAAYDGREPAHNPSTPEAIALRCLVETLRQAKVLFWFSLVTGSTVLLLQVCVIVCGIVHQHTDIQIMSRLLLGLPFNAVAVVAYRQAREFRRWASSLVISTHGIKLASPPGGTPAGGVTLPADLLFSLRHLDDDSGVHNRGRSWHGTGGGAAGG